jgi:hypothetical protein
MKLASAVFLSLSLFLSQSVIAGTNLLKNAGFESAGTSKDAALYWKMNDPDDHGDAWGTAIRIDWRAREGRNIGAVRGSWAGLGDYGGFWQEVEATPGTTYKFTAWFWADGAWRAETQEMKIEFWNSERTDVVGSHVIALHDIGEIWVQKEIELLAPESTAWVRIVINVTGAGDQGALQVDEVSLEASM